MSKKPDSENPAETEIAEPSEYADSELVKKSLKGDLESFELLIERYQQAEPSYMEEVSKFSNSLKPTGACLNSISPARSGASSNSYYRTASGRMA